MHIFILMKLLLIIFFYFFTKNLIGQVKTNLPTKITTAPKIDGKPDDAIWKNINAITDFQKSFPNFGTVPSEKTEVKIAYDNNAIFILAKMYCNLKTVKKQLTQRDVIEFQNADNFTIGLDTYQDRQNAFNFTVTAAGVQGDARVSNGKTDKSWDAVWMSAVSISNEAWFAEIKIPYSAIRFAKKTSQNWGLQLTRFIRIGNETNTWSPQNPNKDGTVNQWGNLNNLENIIPPLRLSFLPYISGGIRNSPTNNGRKTESLTSGGMDVKWGINESFTVDMTLVPDFAQVQSDNVYLNLTPFQVKFDDYRSFFTEGTELFNKAGLFYSRRIGAQPTGVYDVLNFANSNVNYNIEKNPGITRLINATKISGRTKNNLGIGIFNAVTAQMNAVLKNKTSGKDTTIITEPLTNYNVLVLDKSLKNRSSITLTNTNALRKDNSRNANVTAMDLNLFDKQNKYNWGSTLRYSNIWGKLQKYDGYTVGTSAGKVSGKLQYRANFTIESDTYDPNDVGFILNNNSVEYGGSTSYNYNQPTKKYLRHSYNFNVNNVYLYKPFQWQELGVNAGSFFLFKNFWDLQIHLHTRPIAYKDFFESRTPNVVLNRFSYAYLGISGSSDSRKKLFTSYSFGGAESAKVKNDAYYNVNIHLRYRFSTKLQTSFDFENSLDKGQWGFSHRDSVSTLNLNYNDPIIAFRRLQTSNLIFLTRYNFTPRMNWNLRLRHNWTYVTNRSFHKLKNDGTWNNIAFVPNKNKNFNVFNIDMFYTWDFKWGSRLTFSWKNALGNNVALNPYTYNKFNQNINAMFNNPHSNEVSLKLVYFLDYLDLKK